MQISSAFSFPHNEKSFQYNEKKSQSVPIEQKIKKLEELKRKIEQDLTKRSVNPDPKAAQGDNNANSAVNRRILKQIETQIDVLENRRTSANQSTKSPDITNDTRSVNATSRHIDIFA